MNICETEALCESVFCKERRKEGWKNRKEKKRKKQGRNRGDSKTPALGLKVKEEFRELISLGMAF